MRKKRHTPEEIVSKLRQAVSSVRQCGKAGGIQAVLQFRYFIGSSPG